MHNSIAQLQELALAQASVWAKNPKQQGSYAHLDLQAHTHAKMTLTVRMCAR